MGRRVTPTLRTAASEYVEHLTRRRSALSHRTGCRNLIFRLAGCVGNVKVGSLTARHVERFFSTPTPRGAADVSPATWNQYRYLLKGWLVFVQGRGYHSTAPSLLESVPPMRVPRRERRQFTRGELARLIDAADSPRDRALVMFVTTMGCRISEALRLTVADVDLTESTVALTVSKHGGQDRMPLWADTEREVRAWLTAYADAVRPDPLRRTWLLFPRQSVVWSDSTSGQRVTRYHPDLPIAEPQRVMTRLLDRAGLDPERGDNWHTLRRSAARIMYDAAATDGYDQAIRVTSSFLHHQNAATTERYLGLTAERSKRDNLIRAGGFFAPTDTGDGTVTPLRKDA